MAKEDKEEDKDKMALQDKVDDKKDTIKDDKKETKKAVPKGFKYNVNQLSLSTTSRETFEAIVSPVKTIVETPPEGLNLFKVAILTSAGCTVEDVGGTPTLTPQPLTNGWKLVDAETCKEWINGRSYIYDEALATGMSFYLCTDDYTEQLIRDIENDVGVIVIDKETASMDTTTTSKAFIHIMVEHTDWALETVIERANLVGNCVMDISAFGALAIDAGLVVYQGGDKDKMFKSVFMWLEPQSVFFINRKTVQKATWLGETSENVAETQKAEGISMFRREKNFAWLDSYKIGGLDAVIPFIGKYVEFLVQQKTATLYDKDLTQDNIDLATNAINTILKNLISATVIEGDVPLINETKGKAFLIITKPLSTYSSTERKNGVVNYDIFYYKFGRVNRIPLTLNLKS